MKQEFSSKWKASKSPRKQRKYRFNAPLNIRHKFLSANLSKSLREIHSRRSFPLKKGDEVRIMKGEFKKKTGKISLVDNYKSRVVVEGIQRPKKDGTKVNVFFNPSNLQITELNLDDRMRKKSLDRKSGKKQENTDRLQSDTKKVVSVNGNKSEMDEKEIESKRDYENKKEYKDVENKKSRENKE
jgi:large subunit ribosomal protein L24